MNAAEVIDVCRARGVELTTAAGRLRFRAPAGAVDGPLRAELVARRDELIGLLAATCPGCRRPYPDSSDAAKRRCWKCGHRACESCGKPTGSLFIGYCITCDLAGAAG